MNLPEIAVKQPILTIMVFLALLMFGVVAVTMLPQDVMPEMELPALTIVTVYPGATAEEVEQQVTRAVENSLAGTPGLKSVKSKSKENVSFVSLEFEWGSNLAEVSNDTRDKLDTAKQDLPDAALDPMMIKINSSSIPVLMYGILADESYNGLDKIIGEDIVNRLRRVPGVGEAIITGQPTREIKIEVNPLKLQAYNISMDLISKMADLANVSVPGGNIKVGINDLAVRVPGEFSNLDEIKDIIVTEFGGRIIRIRDIANVKDTYKDRDDIERANGRRGAVLLVQKQSGANTKEVAKGIRAAMAEVQEKIPGDVEILEVMDSSILVTESIKNVQSTVLLAGLFVALVVLLFIREIKSSLIIILTIPFSVISSFILMYLAGFSINIFSMIALTIAIGMVVDSAIVVLENITRHMENGVRPMQAAIFGTSEMGLAISASILTTIAVFLPMVFMGGITGVLFKQLALITSITLIGSLFAAMTLTPMLSSRLLKEKGKQTKYRSRVFILSEKIYTSVENRYRKLLEAVTGKPVLTVAITLLITVLSFIAAKGINSDYIPMMDTGDISGYAELPVGTNILEVSRISKKIEDIIYQEVPAEDMLSVYTISGQTERGLLSLMGFKEAKNNIVIGVKLNLPDEREYSSINLAEKIRHRLELIPEIEKLHIDGNSLLEKASLGNSSPIEIKIFGADLTTLNSFSKEIESRMKAYSGLSNVQNTADDGKLELQINTDRDKLRFYGLTQAQVGLAVRHAIFGAELTTKFKENNDEYDIIVQYDKKFVNDINNLGSVLISSLKGQQIPLSAVAEIVEVRAPIEVKREAQQRVVYISGDLAEGVALGTAVKVLKPMIEGMTKPEGIEIEFGGQYEEQQSAFKQLKIMFLIGIILVYMIMASQFGNLLDPFIIMFAIPFAVVGVIWAFLLTGETLSVISFIGLIMLVGIVVNNGIVLVNYTGLLRKRGMTVLEAVIESGYSRLRPVLMTAVTTILGMLPMAMSSGLGSSLWKPLGITVIGGLVISTLITLILIPVLYLLFHHREVGSEVTK